MQIRRYGVWAGIGNRAPSRLLAAGSELKGWRNATALGKNGFVLVEAIVGWVIEAIGDRTLKGVSRGLFGTEDRRSLQGAIGLALKAVTADVPSDAREGVTAALTERFSEPRNFALDGRTGVRDALIEAIHNQIAPLGDTELTGTGRSFCEEVGVDFVQLRSDLSQAVIRAVEQVATTRAALAPLAAQLNADALLSEVRALRKETLRPVSEVADRSKADTGVRPQIFDVVDALLKLEAISDEGARREVLRLLPRAIAGAIAHHAVPRVQVLAILRTCLNYDDGLHSLLRAVRVVEGDSIAMQELDATMHRSFPELPPVSVS